MGSTDNIIDFDDLIGQEFDFYGVDGQCFKLDATIYEAIERDDATFCEVRICCDHEPRGFYELPIARVVVEGAAFTDEMYELTDLHDGHRWLCFGTEVGEYAPEFVFEYTPKAPPA